MDEDLGWIGDELRGARGNDARALGASIAREWTKLRTRAAELEQHADPRVRVALAHALGRIERAPDDEALLVRLFGDPSQDVANAAVAAFRKGYPPAVAQALREIALGDRIALVHVRALSEVRAPSDEPLFRDALAGPSRTPIFNDALAGLRGHPSLGS